MLKLHSLLGKKWAGGDPELFNLFGIVITELLKELISLNDTISDMAIIDTEIKNMCGRIFMGVRIKLLYDR